MWRRRNSGTFFITVALFMLLMIIGETAWSQCSICTRTAEQLGEKPAKGMNAGILYLAFAPFLLVGFIAYRWWRNNKN